jgi:hypothetical protein
MKNFFKNLKGRLSNIGQNIRRKKKDSAATSADSEFSEISDSPDEETNLEASSDENTEEDTEDLEENIVFQEMKVQSTETPKSHDRTQEHQIPEEILTSHDRTSEIKIDPARLNFESDNHESQEHDEVPLENMQEMSIPKNGIKKTPKEKMLALLSTGATASALKAKQALTLVISKIKAMTSGGSPAGMSNQNLEWDKVYEQIFSPEYRKQVHQTFVALSFVATAYGVGKLTALIIKGPEKKAKAPINMSSATGPTPMNIIAIKSNNIFNARMDVNEDPSLADNKPKSGEKKNCLSASKKSGLPLELINTVVLQDSVKSIASVAMRGSKEPLNVRVGEKIETMAEVGKVDRLKLIVKNLKTGECEFLESRDEAGGKSQPINVVGEAEGKKLLKQFVHEEIKNEGNKFKIKKTFRDKMLEDVGTILTQARAIQIKNPDGTIAFKMTEIEPGSIYSYLNILNEDTITKINGKEITNLNEIMTMFGQIKDIDHLSIGVKRDGEDVDMEYNFE